jgi:hypothetical protein
MTLLSNRPLIIRVALVHLYTPGIHRLICFLRDR